MSAAPGTWSSRKRSVPVPTTTPCARDRSTIAPAAASRSMSNWTFDGATRRHDDATDDTCRRQHGHIGRESIAGSLVDGHRPEFRAGAAGNHRRRRRLDSCTADFRSRRPCSVRDCCASARSCCKPDAQRGDLILELGVLGAHILQRHVVDPVVTNRGNGRRRARAGPRRSVPNVTSSSTGTPRWVFTCAEISRMCPTITPMNNQPVRCRISSTAIVSRP